MIHLFSRASSVDGLLSFLPAVFLAARKLISRLSGFPGGSLCFCIDVSRTCYSRDIPQRSLIRALRRQGVVVHPGMTLRYVMTPGRRAVLLSSYDGVPDSVVYRAEFVRSLHSLLVVFGYSREYIDAQLLGQTTLLSFDIADEELALVVAAMVIDRAS